MRDRLRQRRSPRLRGISLPVGVLRNEGFQAGYSVPFGAWQADNDLHLYHGLAVVEELACIKEKTEVAFTGRPRSGSRLGG